MSSSFAVPTSYAGNHNGHSSGHPNGHQNGHNGHAAPSLIQSPRRSSKNAPQPEKPEVLRYDMAAEQACIGAMLMSWGEDTQAEQRGVITQAHELAAAADFFYGVHQKIVALIYKMFWAGEAVDPITVAHAMQESGIYEECGGFTYLEACIERCPGAHNIATYAKIVRKKSEERQARAVIEKANRTMDEGGTLDDVRRTMDALSTIAERSQGQGAPVGFTAAELMALDIPPSQWAIPEFLPAGLSIFAGRPKARKSWFWLQACVAVACGGRIMGQLPAPKGEALYLALEDTIGRLKQRLQLLHRNGPPPTGLHLFTQWPRSDAGGIAQLERWLNAHPNCRLVVVDTLQVFRPQQSEKGNAYQQDYEALRSLKRVADKFGVALVAIHHTTKMSADDPFATISGTYGINGAADALFVIQGGRSDGEAVLHMQGRDLDGQKIALRWDDALWQWNAEGDADQLLLSEERSDVLEFLRSERNPVAIHDIARALQMERQNLKALLWKMKNDGQVVSEGGKYRALNDEEQKARLPRLLRLPFTEMAAPGDFGEAKIAQIIDESGDILPQTPEIWSTVNAVNAVNAFHAHLRETRLNLKRFASLRVEKLRDFIAWWHENYEQPLSQESLETYLPAFDRSRMMGNVPAYLMQPQS